MKAIKLASIFAVSAVAAAVSTTTIAAEPVFSGQAGVYYKHYGDSVTTKDVASGTDVAELELAIDTGVVYLEFEMAGDANADETVNFGLEKAYVTQGAVQFGRFDGTLSDAAALGVNENSGVQVADNGSDTDSTAIRYALSDELSVAVESTQVGNNESSKVGMTLSYIADMGAGEFGVSGGSVGDSSVLNAGYAMDVGSTTLAVSYGTGEGRDSSTLLLEDYSSFAVSAQMTPTDATTLNVEYTINEEEVQTTKVETEAKGLYVYGSYTAGDLEYYVEHYGEDFGDSTEVGVKASF
jgi:hypothetical protein